jgi:peptide/nickel transport system permease protein
VAVVENPVTSLEPDYSAPLTDDTRHFPKVGSVIGAVGLVVLLVAMFVVRSMETVPRSFLAAAGGIALWYGLQKLGAWKFGRDFSLGLILSLVWLVTIVGLTILADWLPIADFKDTDFTQLRARPGLNFDEPLGRDTRGASLLSQVIFAGRVSLTIVVLAVIVGLVVGSLLGLLSGYFGKWIEGTINIATNTTLAFPPLVLLIVIAAVYSRTVWSIGIALAVVSIPTYARIMRAQTILFREREFVTAARAMGASGKRIMFKEILPNTLMPVLSYSFLSAAVIIVAEGSLAFLGLSVQFPTPTWGFLVADGKDRLNTAPHLVFVPATVMFLTVLSLNRIGDYARRRVLGERNTLK